MSENNVNGITGADVATTTGIVGATIGIGQYIVNDYVITIAETEGDYGYTMTITRGTETQTVTLYGLTSEQYNVMLGYLEAAQTAAQSAAVSSGMALNAATRAETAAGQITGMTAEAETLAPGSPATASFLDGVLSLGIPAGAPGADGNGIVSIVKTSTSGTVDTYTITYTNGTTSTFEVTNGSGGGVSDVQVNGVSVVTDGVANVPIANMNTVGVFKTQNYKGFVYDSNTGFGVDSALTVPVIKTGNSVYRFPPTAAQHISTFYGLAKAAGDSTQSASANTVGDYTKFAKSAISEMLNGSVAVTGATPSITALPGVRYVCGEVSTIDITVPATGIIDVVFTSGATPAVLTVTPPNGMTMRWANGFDPTSLDVNTVYEINIMDGSLGVAAAWT